MDRLNKDRNSESSVKFLFADDDKPSIVDAISRMSSKQSSPKKSATKPVVEVRQDISPADFFGLTPVHVGKDSKVLRSTVCRWYCNVYWYIYTIFGRYKSYLSFCTMSELSDDVTMLAMRSWLRSTLISCMFVTDKIVSSSSRHCSEIQQASGKNVLVLLLNIIHSFIHSFIQTNVP